MYNKLFTKILDSSIWLETDATRIVWLTIIAAMDETGFVQFASVANLAHRARVTEQAADEAVRRLESPDPNSSDPDNAGCRIERVPGGWMVLNASKYRDLVTRAVSQEKTRLRVAKFREKKRGVTIGNGDVTEVKRPVTPSEADADTEANAVSTAVAVGRARALPDDEWIKSLAVDPAYQGINVALESAKCARWCETNRKQMTRRRFINWLNNTDRPMAGPPRPPAPVYGAAPLVPIMR
jgi:hypothetical protein